MSSTDDQKLPPINSLGTPASDGKPMPPPPQAQVIQPPTSSNQVARSSSADVPQKGNKKKFRLSPKNFVLIVVLLVVGIGMIAGIALTYRQQIITKQAWLTEQSAESLCIGGEVGIVVSFTNTEPTDSNKAMDVIALDLQTNKSKDLGTVQPQSTQTDTIMLGQSSIDAGQVRFDLTWSSGASGIDNRIANYQAITCEEEEPVSCPLEIKEDGQYLIEFDDRIRADGTETDAKLSKDIQLPAGTYSVTLASFDTHNLRADEDQLKEQYLVVFEDEEGNQLARSGIIADLPDDKNYLSADVGTVTLEQPASILTAFHAAFEDTNPQSLQPICVLLAKENPETTPTPTPTPTPTLTPTPTPTTDACNTTCSQDNECNQDNASLICYEGRCRHRDNTGDTGCNLPTTYSCNSDCTNDNQCLSANSDFLCIQGNCRHKDAPADESCQPPIGGPEPTPTPSPTSAVNGFGASTTPTPETVSQVDLPEAGINEPTLSVLLFGGLFILLGVGVLLVP